MKPMNFPARKLARQIRAGRDVPSVGEALAAARSIRTKKNRK